MKLAQKLNELYRQNSLICFQTFHSVCLFIQKISTSELAEEDWGWQAVEGVKARPCPFIQILSWFYPDFLKNPNKSG